MNQQSKRKTGEGTRTHPCYQPQPTSAQEHPSEPQVTSCSPCMPRTDTWSVIFGTSTFLAYCMIDATTVAATYQWSRWANIWQSKRASRIYAWRTYHPTNFFTGGESTWPALSDSDTESLAAIVVVGWLDLQELRSWTWGYVSKIIEELRLSEQMEAVGHWVFEVVGGRTKTKQRKCLTLGIQLEHVMSEFQRTSSHWSQLTPRLFYQCPLNTSRHLRLPQPHE